MKRSMNDFSDNSIIKYGDIERSRLSGIGSSGELVFKMSSERVQHHVWEA